MKNCIALCLLALTLGACRSAKESFAFEKIAFHSGPCFGVCPSYHLEIRNDRSVLLKGDSLYGKRGNHQDLDRVGYFKGRIADTSYVRLLEDLRAIGLDTVQFKGPDCCDAPMKTLIVYYNGKRKYLRAMFPPDHARALLSTLTGIYKNTRFDRVGERFEIEFDSIPRK